MSESTSTASGGGVGFAGLLTLVFITLKLIGVITWSWWWVLSPIWISVVVALTFAAVAGAVVIIAAVKR